MRQVLLGVKSKSKPPPRHALSLLLVPSYFLRCLALLVLLLGAISPTWAAKTYADNGDGTVTDPTTGLTWMRCSMGQTWDGANSTCTGTTSTYTFDQANALTGTVTFAGQSDWRVPNIRELQTIVDRTVYSPTIDKLAFPSTPNSLFWSGSPFAYFSDIAWFVSFYYGNANDGSRNGSYAVRLVRGGQSFGLLDNARPSSDYVDQGDGTVLHKPTRLLWQRCAVGQSWTGSTCSGTATTVTWDAAKLLTSSFAGQTDWRLPSADELLSLADYSKYNPAINTMLFPNAPSSGFWSGSPDAFSSGYAWNVSFGYGNAYVGNRNSSSAVRLVRGGQCFGPLVLGISKTGTGQISSAVSTGTGTSSQCNATSGYYAGEVVALTASPISSFISWGGACASSGNAPTCTVTMDAAKEVNASFTHTLALQPGWNLVGNGQSQPLPVANAFGVAAQVTTVWKWDALNPGWQFYAPSMDATALQTYAASKGYAVLSTINPGEGFWVNAAQAFTPTLPGGTAITGNDFQAGKAYAPIPGWNLVSVGNPLTPSAFNAGLGTTPPAVGVVTPNLTTLWAWDNPQAKWYFYAPSLEGQGGNALFDYTANKGYLEFTATGKTLGNGTGFWVNMPVSSASAPATVSAISSAVPLSYGKQAQISVTGKNLDQGMVLSAPGCSTLTENPGSNASSRTYSCQVAVATSLPMVATNSAGTLLSVEFAVPDPQVTMVTTLGTIVLELYPAKAPLSVDNFLKYTRDRFYDDLLFHRVIAGFMVQGGGFTKGPVAKTPTYAPIKLESNNGLKNLRSTLAMARTTAVDSATSQFFINLVDNAFLDYSAASAGYAVFGKVVDGMAVVDAMAAVPTGVVGGMADVPKNDILILSAVQTR